MSAASDRVTATADAAAPTAARAAGRSSTLARLCIVASEEYRRALESRWLFGFAILLAALVVGLSFFGLAHSREVGFQGFARVTLSLMNLVLFTVPLLGLVLGVTSVATSGASLALLLAQPVARSEVYFGKYLGLCLALTVAQAVGFGAGGVAIALNVGADQLRGYVVLTALSFALGWLSIATSMWIGTLWPDRLKSLAVTLGLWLAMVVAYDLAVLGATAVLRGVPLQAVLVPALILNPVDLARILTTLATGSGALFGPTSAVLVRWFGAAGGVTLAIVTLVLETAIPLLLGVRRFARRDW